MSFEAELGRAADASEAATTLVAWLPRVGDRSAAVDATVEHLVKLGLSETLAEKELCAELALVVARMVTRFRRRR